MNNLNHFDFTIGVNPLLLIGLTIIISLYSYYVYKFTIPSVSTITKITLISIRSLALIILLILLLEPVLLVNSKTEVKPVNLIFFDNSSSMRQYDSIGVISEMQKIYNELNGILDDESYFYTFGGDIDKFDLQAFNLNDRFTNFENIARFVDTSDKNINNIILISDGILTTGANPIRKIEEQRIPYRVIGIGDTTKHNDISIKSILTNKILYSGKQTSVEAVILNKGFGGSKTGITISEDNKIIGSQNISLDNSGINRIIFNYTPTSPGEKKLTVSVSPAQSEISHSNNKLSVYRDVADSKIKIFLISGSPSSDFSFIKSAISKDENYELNSTAMISSSKWTNDNYDELIDSSDIFILLNFPTSITGRSLSDKIFNVIAGRSKPYLIITGSETDFQALKKYEPQLPFLINSTRISFIRSQQEILDNTNSLFSLNGKIEIDKWANLSPVYSVNSGLAPKTGTSVIAGVKLKGITTGTPFIINSSSGMSRSIAVLGFDLWRWKLNPETSGLYDQFIRNIVEWLNVNPNQQRFNVETDKKVYAFGENIEFSAELYDEKMSPVSEAEISVSISGNEDSQELFLIRRQGNLYTGTITAGITGDLKYTATAKVAEKVINSTSGRFTVEEADPEKLRAIMDKEFLNDISLLSGGKYYSVENINELIKDINEYNRGKTEIIHSSSENKIWSNEILLYLIVILFSIEWFLRKRLGML
ncbi:MAG: hypothetical protein JW995_10930 [Melioribacteraceae bacterium]|nr:hypothetical protein [Melioribacteraceae bacterium]